MNTVGIEKNEENPKARIITTTLFDLIACMQDKRTHTADEAFIVPTVAEWIRSGRIRFQRDVPAQTAA